MNTKIDKRQLAIDLCYRSSCKIKMAAVIYDSHGIISWGWNSLGHSGLGWHAEEHAISRANRRRLKGSSIIVVGVNAKDKPVFARPCEERCLGLLKKVGIRTIEFRGKDEWFTFTLR